jgi:hypothetical protein
VLGGGTIVVGAFVSCNETSKCSEISSSLGGLHRRADREEGERTGVRCPSMLCCPLILPLQHYRMQHTMQLHYIYGTIDNEDTNDDL